MTMNRLAIRLLVLSLLFLGGCIPIPTVPSTAGKEITDADLAFIKVGVTKRSEIVERFGDGTFFEELNVLYYGWSYNMESAFLYWGLTAPDIYHKYVQSCYGVYILFDSNGHVKRFYRGREPNRPVDVNIREWLESE